VPIRFFADLFVHLTFEDGLRVLRNFAQGEGNRAEATIFELEKIDV
jgi:hypothetical protein